VIPRISPMLATIARKLPDDQSKYGFEVKWDGVRALTYIEDGHLYMESRNRRDITPRYPELLGLIEALDGRSALLDGEVVAFDAEGKPSFQRLQERMHLTGESEVRHRMGTTPVAYLLFDLLWLDDTSLIEHSYRDRRQALAKLGLASVHWQVSPITEGDGDTLLDVTKARGLEGVVAKKLDSVYEPGRRSRCWLKIKNIRRQEMVVGGWVNGEGAREGRIGALLIGYYDDSGLRFAGKVGTGFSNQELDRLGKLLRTKLRDTSPFVDPVPWKNPTFVEPDLVAEVEFTEWTNAGTVRHPSYKGMRDDKAAIDVTREA
jgi:bifunctional non-homologous end joining protein LigD